MPELVKRDGGIKAAQLLIAAGFFTIVNNVLPGNGHLDVRVLYLTGGFAIFLGGVSLLVPWERLPQRTSMLLAVVAFGLVSVSDAYGGVSDFSYAIYFVVIFVWVGLAQPPYTSLMLAPLAALAYLAPDLAAREPELASSATVAIPVCVLVGEVVARATGRHRRASDGLRERVLVVERLATLTARIGTDPDPEAVYQALVDCAASIFEGPAVFASLSGTVLIPKACRGLDASILRTTIPLAQTSVERAAASPRLIAISEQDGTTLPLPPGGCALTVACRANDDIIGALTVVLERGPSDVTDEIQDVLRLIGAQGEVALGNAATRTALIDEHRHEQAVFDVLLDGVIVLDSRGRVQSCNDAAADVFGWAVESMIGRPLPIAIEDGEAIETEISAGRWIETSAVRLPEGGETAIALRDVSRQHALDEAKDLFLATTSHELRTPLTAIKGYVSTLQRHWSRLSDADRRRALSVVDEQVDSLIRLTDHLLLSARAAANPSPRVSFDVGMVARKAAAAYGEVSEQHLICADVESGLPLAFGDPDSVRSILAQLIENAVKYSPGGGEVRIEVRRDGERVVVDVLDRGVGIQAGRAETLFAPFMQGQAVNTRSFGGVGLGLYIVRRLVIAQGGEITAFSRDGGGSGFRFWLPTPAGLPAPRRSAEMTTSS